MKKIRSILTLKKVSGTWRLIPQDWPKLTAEVVEVFTRPEVLAVELEIEIKNPFKYKTTSQLGYLHAEVWKKVYEWAKSVGNEWTDEECRDQLKAHLNFVEQKESKVNGELYWDIKSCADASKEEVSDLIDSLIRFLGEEGIKVQTPEEYLKAKGIDNFDEYKK
jgi:hypothetical protein